MNVPAAMTINSRVVKTLLACSPDAPDIPLKNGLRVQVLPNMDVLSYARKAQSAAFVASEGLLVVWDDGMPAGCDSNGQRFKHADERPQMLRS